MAMFVTQIFNLPVIVSLIFVITWISAYDVVLCLEKGPLASMLNANVHTNIHHLCEYP